MPNIDFIRCIDYTKTLSNYSFDTAERFHKTNINPEKSFWLVYSSGTTGKNKGISISHRAILSSYEIRESISSYNQDSSIGCNIYYLWEAFRPLLKGEKQILFEMTFYMILTLYRNI